MSSEGRHMSPQNGASLLALLNDSAPRAVIAHHDGDADSDINSIGSAASCAKDELTTRRKRRKRAARTRHVPVAALHETGDLVDDSARILHARLQPTASLAAVAGSHASAEAQHMQICADVGCPFRLDLSVAELKLLQQTVFDEYQATLRAFDDESAKQLAQRLRKPTVPAAAAVAAPAPVAATPEL